MSSERKRYSVGELTINHDAKRIPVKEADRKPGKYPYYGASGIVDWVDQYIFDGEFLLVAEDGENLRSRKTPVAFMATGRFWVNNHAHIIQGNQKADTRFLAYILEGSDISGYLTGSTIPKLSQGSLNAIEIEVPCLGEQKAIAHVLGTLDDKIELNRKTNETLEGIAKAVFKSWFVDFDPVRAKAEGRPTGLPDEISELFPDSFEESELGEVPSGWEVQRLEDLVELSYGKALKETDRIPGPFPVFGSNGVVGSHKEALVEGPGIIVGRKGNPGIVKWSKKDFFPIDTTFYVKPKMEGLRLSFLFYALSNQRLPALSADSAVPGLNRSIAYMNQQVLPPFNIVLAFDQMVSTIFERMSCLSSEEETLSSLRDALLPRLISGELRVPDAEKMLEEVDI